MPLLAEPELNTSRPLTPVVPAFALRIEITPLLVAVPSPLSILTDPPVGAVLRPESKLRAHAFCLVTVTPEIFTMPPRPPIAAPEPMISPPLFPAFDVPVLNTSIPLDPDAPEFALRITMLPLVDAVPSPLSNRL